jgi:hypothetical protein
VNIMTFSCNSQTTTFTLTTSSKLRVSV